MEPEKWGIKYYGMVRPVGFTNVSEEDKQLEGMEWVDSSGDENQGRYKVAMVSWHRASDCHVAYYYNVDTFAGRIPQGASSSATAAFIRRRMSYMPVEEVRQWIRDCALTRVRTEADGEDEDPLVDGEGVESNGEEDEEGSGEDEEYVF